MADYIVEFGGQKYKTSADSSAQVWEAIRGQVGDAGAIITSPSGSSTFVSSGYSTTDREQIDRIRSEQLSAPEASRRSIFESVVREDPILTRAATATQGVPFVGEYADEALGLMGFEGGQQAMRLGQKAMAETRPGQTAALQLGTGLATTAPLAAAALPSRGVGLGRAMLTGATLGTAGGSLEGAVSGYGAGETPEERVLNAQQRAIIGGSLGGALGTAAPAVGAGIGKLASGIVGGGRVARLARDMGLSPEAARVAGSTAEFEPNIAIPDRPASLAEISPEMRSVLDLSMSVPSAGRAEARDVIDQQAREAAQRLNANLDAALGEPSGKRLREMELMRDTAERRAELYSTAYSRPIDYSSEAGVKLEELLDRLDDSIIRGANELMRLEGRRSGQIMAEIADDGTVSYRTLPDVLQIDYITRALQSRANTMGAEPEAARAFRSLTAEIRETADELVPEYAAARSEAARVIGEREALSIGEDVLGSGMKREDVQLAVEGMTPGELANVRSGIRQRIDDIIARASAPLDPDGEEYKEALKALRLLRSREARDKLRLVLGEDAGDALMQQINETIEPIAVRAQVGRGSQTAPRQFAEQALQEQIAPGIAERIGQAGPAAIPQIAGDILASGSLSQSARRSEVSGELAPLLSRQMRPSDLDVLLRNLRQVPRATGLQEAIETRAPGLGLLAGATATPAATTELTREDMMRGRLIPRR
jgi:hypothetical protein